MRTLRSRQNPDTPNKSLAFPKEIINESRIRKEAGKAKTRNQKKRASSRSDRNQDDNEQILQQSDHSSNEANEEMQKELEQQLKQIKQTEKETIVHERKRKRPRDTSEEEQQSESSISQKSRDIAKKCISNAQIESSNKLMKKSRRMKSEEEEYYDLEFKKIKREKTGNTEENCDSNHLQTDGNIMPGDQTEYNQFIFKYSNKTLILPSCTQWFDLDSIHQLEVEQLPEYFNGRFPHKNPHSYIIHRNQIVKLYRESPNAYLSASLCRKHIASDSCSVIRLHAFLEQWGIINFNVENYLNPPQEIFKDCKQQLINAASQGAVTVAQAAHIQKTTPNEKIVSLDQLALRKAHILSATKQLSCNVCQQFCGLNFYIKKPPMFSLQNQEIKESMNFNCDKSLQFVMKNILQSLIICYKCFESNNYPKSIDQDDFEYSSLISMLGFNDSRIENEPWSIEDEIKLIEGIKTWQLNWKAISSKVFQDEKSEYQCLQKFLSMDLASLSQGHSTSSVNSLNARPSVFQDQNNPLFFEIGIIARDLELLEQQKRQEQQQEQQPRDQCLRSHDKRQELLNKYTKKEAKLPKPKKKTSLPESLIAKVKQKAETSALKQLSIKSKQIGELMDLVNYYQFKKLQNKYNLAKQFKQIFEWGRKDIRDTQETIISERLAISLSKNSSTNKELQYILKNNEGASQKSNIFELKQ